MMHMATEYTPIGKHAAALEEPTGIPDTSGVDVEHLLSDRNAT
jgi:hypothetical protein